MEQRSPYVKDFLFYHSIPQRTKTFGPNGQIVFCLMSEHPCVLLTGDKRFNSKQINVSLDMVFQLGQCFRPCADSTECLGQDQYCRK